MPRPDLLETFDNPYSDREYEIHMICDEFTSLCPLGGIEGDATDLRALEGGAPDFATIRIRYVPAEVCVELKSLKLYLWSFRNDGIFYERAVNRILDDLAAAVQPKPGGGGGLQRARGDQVGDHGAVAAHAGVSGVGRLRPVPGVSILGGRCRDAGGVRLGSSVGRAAD